MLVNLVLVFHEALQTYLTIIMHSHVIVPLCQIFKWFKHIIFHVTWKGIGQSKDSMSQPSPQKSSSCLTQLLMDQTNLAMEVLILKYVSG